MAKDAYTTFIKNFGKSIAYSSLEVLKSASPNLTEIGSQAMEEAQALRDTLAEARTKNPMQIRTMDLSKIQKDVKGVIDSTIEDLRTGNLSAPREMDLDDFLGDDEDFGLDEATENESPESVAKGASLEAKVSVASANMLNATIAESSRSSITAQANVARAMIRSSQNLTLTQTKHLGAAIQQTNAHLAQINQNLVSIINFMNQNQSVVNQATLKFMDQGQAYMKAHMAILQPPKKKQSGNNQLNFMTGNSFNLSDYIKYVKSNIKNNDAISSMQAMGSMAGMAGNMMSSFGLKNTVRPTQMAMNALMGMIIPKNIQRAIKNVDALLPSAITAGLANLGDIGERDYGIKGSIAKVLGVSSKRLKTVNLGDYNKGAVPWDGTSKKALEEVIPTLLGLIEAHTRTLDPGGSQDAKIYDYNRGVFTTVNKASADLKNKGTEMKWDAMKGIRGLLDAKDQDGQLVMGYAQRKEVLKVLDKYFQEATVDARLQNPDADDRALREIQKDLQKDLLALKVDPAQVRMYSFQFASAVGQYVNSVRMWAPDMSQTYRQALALTADTDAFGNAKFDSKFYGSFADETERMKAQRKKQEEIDNRARQMSKDLKGITDRFSRDDGGETGYSLPKRLLKQLLLLPSTGVFGSSETTTRIAQGTEAALLTLVDAIGGTADYDKYAAAIKGRDKNAPALEQAKSIAEGLRAALKNQFDDNFRRANMYISIADVKRIMLENGLKPEDYKFVGINGLSDNDAAFYSAIRYTATPGTPLVIYPKDIVLSSGSGGKSHITAQLTGTPEEEARKKAEAERLKAEAEARQQAEDAAKKRAAEEAKARQAYEFQMGDDDEFVRMLGIVNTVNRAKEDPKAIAARAKDAADALKNPFSRIIENLALIEHHTRPLDEDYTPPAGLGHGIRRGLGSGRSYRRSLGGALGGADLDFDSSYEVNQIVNEAIIFTSHLKPDHASYLKVVEYITATVQTVSNSNMSRSDKEDAIRQLYGVMGVFQKASQGAIEASQAENKADEEALKEAVEGAQEASQEAAEQIAENALTPEEKKNSQLDKFMSNFKGLKKHSGRAVKGAILGAILGPGGPLVGAAVGAAAGILTSKVDFKSFVFGSRSVDKDGNVHVKTGILGQWSNMFKASLIPHMKTIGEDLKDSLKESFSTAFEPITIALKKSKADKKIGGMLDMIEDKVGGVVNAVLHPIKFANGLLVQTVDRLLTGGISAAGSLLGTGIRTVGKASGFLTNHIGDIFGSKTSKANLKAQKELRGVRSENFFGDLSSSFKEGGIKGIFGTGRRMADKEMARYQQMLSEVDTSTTEGKAKERELKALMASADRRGTGAKENKLYDKSMRQLARKYNFSAGKMTDKQMEYAKKRLSEHMTKDNDDFEFWNTFKDKMTGEQLRRYIIGDSTVKDELKANAAAEAKEKTEHNYRTSVLGFMSGILHWLTGDKKADVVDPDKTTGEAVVAQINSDMTSASEKQEAAAADADAAKKREAAVQKEKAEHKATVAAGAAHADATPDDQADSGITEEEMEGSRANAVGENDGLFGDSDEEGGGGIFGFFKNIFGGMSSSGLLGAGAVGLLLGTEAGRDITGKILGAVGPLISNVGEKLLGWAGDAMADLGKDIKDKVTTFGKSLIPGTKENQKATKNGNLSAAQLADIDPSLVSGAVDNGDGTMTIGTNSNRGTWLRDTLYKGASHFIRKGPGATLNNLKAGTKLVGKGLAFGAKALSVPVKLATKGIGKTVGAIGKGGATLLKKGIEGASSLSGKAAEKIAASGAKGGVMGKVKSILEGMKKTLDSLTGNKNIVTALEGTGAKPQGFLSKITSYLDDAIKKLTSKADDMAKGFGSKIDDVYQKFIGSTAGSVIKAAAIVFTTAWGAFNGWQDTAKLFEVNEEDVDGLMRTISIIFRIFLDTSAFIGAGLELLDIIYEGIFGKSFIKTLANGLYNFLFSFTGKKAKGDKSLDEKQNAFIAEYEKYLKDNNLTKEEMPFADYNALKNATLVDKAGNWIGSKFNAVKTAITEWWKGPTVQKSENATTSPVGAGFKTKGGKSRGGGAGSLTRNAGAGLGGTISQYDPKFANRVYGQGRGTVQSDGCGLVAIANAKEALGGAADILDQVGRAERRAGGLNNRTNQVNLRGYSPQALGPLGMTATELHSVDEIRKNLENGTPVNIAGMGGLGGGLYGGPGNSHIVNALGYNPDGTIRVQDGKGVVNVSEDELFNGAHHAFAMGLGGRPMNAMSVSDGKSKSGKPSGSYTASNKKGTGTAAKTGSAGNGAANNATEIVGEPLQAGNGVNVTNGMYYFAQSDPRWRDQTLSGYTSTLHHTGCVLTSAAMGVASLLGDPTLTPDVINKYGNGNVGSTKFDALGIKVERVPPGGNGNVDADPAAYQQQIMAALKAGMPVMLYGTKTANNVYYDGTTGTNHCVLATGIDENGNILINNPWANGNGTRPVGTEGVSWTFDQLRPFHWAQIMSYNGKGVSGRRADGVVTGDYTTPGSGNYVSGTIGTSGVSGAAASGASDSSSTMQGATDSSSNSANSASGEEEEKKPGPLDAFAAFGTAMSNAASDVLGAVMSGRSYKEVRAERKAREAEEEAAANETMGAGLGGAARAGKKNPNIKIKGAKAVKPKSMYIVNNRGEFEEVGRETTSVSPEDMIPGQRLESAQNSGPRRRGGKGLGGSDTSMINSLVENMSQSMSTNSDGYGDKFDEMIRLLAEISSNTSNGDTGKTTSGVGSGDKSMGSNSIVSKAGKRTATQKRQDAMNKAKYKLQSLSNGSNTGMGRSDLRSIWEQVSKPSY